jgi:hypothetical protein
MHVFREAPALWALGGPGALAVGVIFGFFAATNAPPGERFEPFALGWLIGTVVGCFLVGGGYLAFS